MKHMGDPDGLLAGDSPLLDSLLKTTSLLKRVAQNPQYELQIIYTQIDRDAQNRPTFNPHIFHLNPRQYFNPASLVKFPVVALSLEKLNDLHQPGVTRRTIMATGTAFRCQTPVPFAAPADSDRTATVGNYIKRMLLVSDNVAYNRLYEFLGQRHLNQRLQELGYPNARITRRFAPCDTAANRHTNPISFHTPTGDTLYKQPAQFNPIIYRSPLGRVLKGRAHQAGRRLIPEPYDFTTANHLPLPDITAFLQNILFPESVPTAQRPHLTTTDYAFLRRYLHTTPHESGFHLYAPTRYFDAYKKYLYYGRNPDLPQQSTLRIYNIVGMSHGYLADVSYFADSLHQSEFLLSAVLYVNQDGIINDGAYEYDTIGQPFLAQLGRLIRQYESQRTRQHRPDLTEFFAPEPIR
ncbi:serine hydrolase [Hymenobacter properus]|uniref:Serine hydrolase n=1 Tax=Hymenobacter properus TaxID=2791026 RepID=A0A931BEF1_9BACT|nr:serine hydrolase [Hymenobacter properus]MBF9142370.1 serine hydrolase [Hymenobacter properus]MBR7721177.1 serine hydrolase [Microvirga sp. SRT04]